MKKARPTMSNEIKEAAEMIWTGYSDAKSRAWCWGNMTTIFVA
jgi:hypothetical protein